MRIGKDFSFEAAHRLQNHNGKCRNLHGHSYRVFVSVEGDNNLTVGGSSEGMLFDFGVLSEWWKPIEANFDHVAILQENDPLIEGLAACQSRMAIFPWPPTAEHLAYWLQGDLHKWLLTQLGTNFSVTVRVYETAKSWAEV